MFDRMNLSLFSMLKHVWCTFQVNVCLSVILEFCLLLSVACLASAAYTNLCKGLKYLLIVPWLDLWLSRLWSRLCIWAHQKHCPIYEKKQKWTAFVFGVSHSFTKPFQNMCLFLRGNLPGVTPMTLEPFF